MESPRQTQGETHGGEMFHIGTASWTIPPGSKEKFTGDGTHLERYARQLNGVEINSSFYREHKPETYAKWAESVPDEFRFSVKLLRYFTQEKRLKETGERLKEIIAGMSMLGKKWGALLVQLPPSLSFNQQDAEKFISDLRSVYSCELVWEPRHVSWASDRALDLMASYDISKVLADPEPCFVSRERRIKVERLVYFRLHGSPEIYKSRYGFDVIERLAKQMRRAALASKPSWCIFDNTTFGHATENALELKEFLTPATRLLYNAPLSQGDLRQ